MTRIGREYFELAEAYVLGFLRWCFQCRHARAPVAEGKCYCPDCGRGLIFRWRVLHCTGCNHRRETRYLLRQIVPLQTCCPFCGEAEVQLKTLVSPFYYQLKHARLVPEEDGTGEHPLFTNTRAWLELGKRRFLPT